MGRQECASRKTSLGNDPPPFGSVFRFDVALPPEYFSVPGGFSFYSVSLVVRLCPTSSRLSWGQTSRLGPHTDPRPRPTRWSEDLPGKYQRQRLTEKAPGPAIVVYQTPKSKDPDLRPSLSRRRVWTPDPITSRLDSETRGVPRCLVSTVLGSGVPRSGSYEGVTRVPETVRSFPSHPVEAGAEVTVHVSVGVLRTPLSTSVRLDVCGE